ncbi:hypothetical protein ScPMuIL_000468 [Solemya velum]
MTGYSGADCPQCRTRIDFIQPIRLDVSDTTLRSNDDVGAVWKSYEWEFAIQQILYQLKTSRWGKLLSTFKENVSSNPLVEQLYKHLQMLKRVVADSLEEFQATEGVDNRMLLLWRHTENGVIAVREKLKQVQMTGYLKDGWRDLPDVSKLLIIMMVVVFLTAMVSDFTYTSGVCHSLIIPVAKSLLCIFYEIIFCIFYTLFRPILCIINCLLEIIMAFINIATSNLLGVVMVIKQILSIPWILLTFMINMAVLLLWAVYMVITGLVRTVVNIVPLFALAYYFSADVQQWTKNFLQKLQSNRPTQLPNLQ